LKPNDFGLFDMQGNAFEWVYDEFVSYPAASDEAASDSPSTESVDPTGKRLLRGGSFGDRPSVVRSAYRGSSQPTNRYILNGFRPSRTYHLSTYPLTRRRGVEI
jgi:formylglycine-generating enzyme required for sulfatase activity